MHGGYCLNEENTIQFDSCILSYYLEPSTALHWCVVRTSPLSYSSSCPTSQYTVEWVVSSQSKVTDHCVLREAIATMPQVDTWKVYILFIAIHLLQSSRQYHVHLMRRKFLVAHLSCYTIICAQAITRGNRKLYSCEQCFNPRGYTLSVVY